jgi:3-hydroxyacyl-CoA dehydrogenase
MEMINKIGVIGTGEMGRGLSLVFSKVGLEVTAVGINQDDLDHFMKAEHLMRLAKARARTHCSP